MNLLNLRCTKVRTRGKQHELDVRGKILEGEHEEHRVDDRTIESQHWIDQTSNPHGMTIISTGAKGLGNDSERVDRG